MHIPKHLDSWWACWPLQILKYVWLLIQQIFVKFLAECTDFCLIGRKSTFFSFLGSSLYFVSRLILFFPFSLLYLDGKLLKCFKDSGWIPSHIFQHLNESMMEQYLRYPLSFLCDIRHLLNFYISIQFNPIIFQAPWLNFLIRFNIMIIIFNIDLMQLKRMIWSSMEDRFFILLT